MCYLEADYRLLFQQQELIEFIRNGKIEEALKFAQENLAEKGEENPKILVELERTLALLAFENPEKSPFGDLLNVSQRFRVKILNFCRIFNEARFDSILKFLRAIFRSQAKLTQPFWKPNIDRRLRNWNH